MIPISESIEIIKRETPSLGSETIDLDQVVGRVLAENIVADTDLPPFDRSQMDGFSVVAKDTARSPVELQIVGESSAGSGWHHELHSGQSVRIMTGAPVPKGSDAVQKVELTREQTVPAEIVEILESVKAGQSIVPRGFEITKGQNVFEQGETITANMIASIAAFGYSKVKVFKRPIVAILPTGSEIVPIGETPGIDQIRDSNSVMLKALCGKMGISAELLPIADDDLPGLKTAILDAVDSRSPRPQILIITGGVSVGKYDFTKTALREIGAEIVFDKVKLKPGKPTVFAKFGNTLIFGLPGNPVSSAVTFYLFVKMAILQMQRALATDMKGGFAITASSLRGAKERDTYLPAELQTDSQASLTATPLKWHGSSDFIGFARAEALIVVPKGKKFQKGEIVRVVYL
ncbi:MAG: molybdopterin molybdotransferase MoeA [Saprospiraceae bacterium]|nr:molybdopterin molybdotransferase MoeA [Pyrinomonadaceae bacterium]